MNRQNIARLTLLAIGAAVVILAPVETLQAISRTVGAVLLGLSVVVLLLIAFVR
jgi:hypothetical protein